MNSCTFAGYVGGDGVVRDTQNGPVLNFRLAVKRYKQEEPLWVSVAVWGERADKLVEYITKGQGVVATGEIDLKTYESKDSGEVTDLTLNARNVTLLGSGRSFDRGESRNESRGNGLRESRGNDNQRGFGSRDRGQKPSRPRAASDEDQPF